MIPTNQEPDRIALDFLREEAMNGHLESTIPEIARGLGISYVEAIRFVERAQVSGTLLVRERGTAKRATRFFTLAEIVRLCKATWRGEGSISDTTRRVTSRG
jgi:hypothetical protein